jgi:hypothetical protein
MTRKNKALMLTWPVTYHYYVVYQYAEGIGATEFYRSQPFKTFADVTETAKLIQKRNRFKKPPVITNWILL